jgi:TonB family protein
MKSLIFFALTVLFLQEGAKSEQPCVVHAESPHYPPIARQVAVQGKVSVSAVIDPQGNVISAEAITGHPLLKEASVANLQKWKFQPSSGAESRIEVTYEFALEDTAPSLGEEVSFDLPYGINVRSSRPAPIIDTVQVRKKHWWSRN